MNLFLNKPILVKAEFSLSNNLTEFLHMEMGILNYVQGTLRKISETNLSSSDVIAPQQLSSRKQAIASSGTPVALEGESSLIIYKCSKHRYVSTSLERSWTRGASGV